MNVGTAQPHISSWLRVHFESCSPKRQSNGHFTGTWRKYRVSNLTCDQAALTAPGYFPNPNEMHCISSHLAFRSQCQACCCLYSRPIFRARAAHTVPICNHCPPSVSSQLLCPHPVYSNNKLWVTVRIRPVPVLSPTAAWAWHT